MATIGYSYWGSLHPDSISPDGAKYTRWQLFNRLLERGHRIIPLQRQRDKIPSTRKDLFAPENVHMFEEPHFRRFCTDLTWEPEGFPEVDFVILENRWKQFGPDQEDFARQNALLHYYGEKSIPCLLWDQDHKVGKGYELEHPRAILVEPSDKPKFYTRKRYTWHYAADKDNVTANPNFSQLLSYVGNNYDRDRMFGKYIGEVAEHFPKQLHVYGNWLKKPKRNEYVLDPDTNVAFHESVPQSAIHDIYHNSGATILITKSSYAKTCLMSIRLLEAVHAGTIVLGPSEIHNIKYFVLPENIVSSTADVVRRLYDIRDMSMGERQQIVNRQMDLIAELNTHHAVEVLNKILLDAAGQNFQL